jgi:PAS domain S-box-containing protein
MVKKKQPSNKDIGASAEGNCRSKSLEEAFVKSEGRYRTILDQMQDSYYEVDLAGNYIFVSESAGHSLGYTREELLGQNYRLTAIEEDTKGIFAAFNEVYRTGKPNKGFAHRIRHKDGSILFSEVSIDLKRNEQREVIGFKCVSRDTTERKQVEAALKESEQNYRLLADYHKRLNDFSISFSEAADTHDLFNRIAVTFRLLTGAVASSFSVYEEETRELKVVSLSIDPVKQDEVSSVFGPDMLGMRIPVSADDMKEMLSQGIRRPKDLYELSSGLITRELSDALMDAAGCRQIVALAITYATELSGTCVAYLPLDQPVVPDEALKTYIYLSGLAIKRRKTEDALRESEEQLSTALENAPDGVYINDLEGNFLYGNRRCEEIIGYKREELIGKNFLELNILPENSLARAAEILQDNINGKSTGPDELELTSRDGCRVPVEINTSVIQQGGKKVVLAFVRDISERKRVEKLLIDNEARYRSLFENNPAAVYSVDRQGRFTSVNAAAMRLTGYSEEEALRISIADVAAPDYLDIMRSHFVDSLRGESQSYEAAINAKDGKRIYVYITGTPIIMDGNIVGVYGIAEDISDRRRLEEEQQRVAKLESVGLLAGGIAHDFNNILTAILGNISLAGMEAQEGSELHGSLEEAQKAVLRAKDLTKQLLTFSRGGAPVMKLSSLRELLKDTSDFALRGSNVKCVFSIPDDLWHAEIDAGQVSQVIHNLVINAQQAMPEGGTIELTTQNIALSETRRLGKGLPLKKGNYVRIAVTDHGSGIPAQHMDRIFDPFFTTKQKGSGLGLATSFSIARQHGGHLSAVSAPNSGSTFYLYLPASRAKSTPRRDNKMEIKPADKARILVMDDEKGVREVAGRMLRHVGYRDIEFAADGAEAIKLYKAAMESGNPFTVAILDLTIPGGMGGKMTVKKLHKIDPGVKAIVSSGYVDDSVIAKYKEYGFSGIVAKPYTIEELRKALQDVIG